jgi:hypothetical protein
MHAKLMLIALSAALAFAAGSASASLVSVNFYADGKPDGVQVESELLGPLGGGNTTWTQTGSNSDTNPVDSSGSNTTIGFSINTDISENDLRDAPNPDLVIQIGSKAQFAKGADSTLTISDLTPHGVYDLAVASTQFIDGSSIDPRNWVLGTNSGLFEEIVADGSGNITILADAADADELFVGSPAYRMHVNGFQIQEVPEPWWAVASARPATAATWPRPPPAGPASHRRRLGRTDRASPPVISDQGGICVSGRSRVP